MNHPSRFLGLLLGAISLCLIVCPLTLIYGHWGGGAAGLSLSESYLTEYMRMAPHWPWLVVASFVFALMLSFVALALLLLGPRSPIKMMGCLLLAATSMGTYFVAYTPMRRVEQPSPPSHEWWTPTWWFTSKTSRTTYEHGMSDAYTDVHYRATRLVVVTSVCAILLIGIGDLGAPETRQGAWITIAMVTAMTALFLMGDRHSHHHGLWQRLGFAFMYGWLWAVHRKLRTANRKTR